MKEANGLASCGKYVNELTDTDCKLMANDVAKDKIIASINKVKQGLINNVK
jgi:hypothetical protein